MINKGGLDSYSDFLVMNFKGGRGVVFKKSKKILGVNETVSMDDCSTLEWKFFAVYNQIECTPILR